MLKAHSFTSNQIVFFFATYVLARPLCTQVASLLHSARTKPALGNRRKSGCLAALASKQAASTAELQHNAFAHGGADVAMAQSCTAQ